ncbi:hypothetical protein NMG60_11022881 [Bertholletia excelsa]
MEEPKPAQAPNTDPNPNPPSTAQTPPPPPPQATEKRGLDQNGNIQSSSYFKMRAVLKELRPHVIEVLRTPVFHKCNAAQEILEQMKCFMELYKEMTAETISIVECNTEGPLPGETQDAQKDKEDRQEVKPVEQASVDRVFAKPSEEKSSAKSSEEKSSVLLGNITEQQQGTYVVGGSAFGWNFVTYPSNKPVYYGRTKEMFRSGNGIPSANEIPLGNHT